MKPCHPRTPRTLAIAILLSGCVVIPAEPHLLAIHPANPTAPPGSSATPALLGDYKSPAEFAVYRQRSSEIDVKVTKPPKTHSFEHSHEHRH